MNEECTLKKLYILLGLAIALSTANAKITIDYTVKNGETLLTIAKKYHTTATEIIQSNRLTKGTPLKLGKVLKVTMNTVVEKKKKSPKLHKHIVKQVNKIAKIKKTHTLEEAKVKYYTKKHKTEKPVSKLAKLSTTKSTHTLDEVKKIYKKHTLEETKVKYYTKKHKTEKPVSKLAKLSTTKSTHTLDEVKKIYKNHTIKIAKITKQKKHPFVKVAKAKKIVQKKHVLKHVKKRIKVVTKKKVKSEKLAKLLNKHSKPLHVKKSKKRQRVTVDDILFKSSQRHVINVPKSNGSKASKIINIAKTKLGRRYVWGATGQRGTFDCSGFTSYVYKKNGISIPRTSRNQSKFGKYISRNHLKKGDLIFFDTSKRRKGYVNHVGIYLGNGKFIHASSAKKKVVVSKLSKFYAQRYVGARRPS